MKVANNLLFLTKKKLKRMLLTQSELSLDLNY